MEEKYIKPYYLTPKQKYVKELIAGTAAGIVGKTASAPFERLKLLLQTSYISDKVFPPYSGITDGFRRVIKEQGVLSLWRGNMTNILRYTSLLTIHQYTFDNLKRNVIVRPIRADMNYWTYARSNFIAGMIAAIPAVIITYPLDVLYTKIASDAGAYENRRFQGLRHAYQKVKSYDGKRGLYLYANFSIYTIMLHRMIYLGMYDTAKYIMLPDPYRAPLWQTWFVAQAVVATAGYATYPLDTVRRRLLVQYGGRLDKPYDTYHDAIRRIFFEEGIKGFYKGAFANVFRGMAAAAALVTWDFTRRYYGLDDHLDDALVRSDL